MSRKKTNKIEAETGEVVQSNRPFIIRNGGIAKPLGQGLYLLGGKTHEQGGIDIDFTGDARIFSAQPILNGNSPAELVTRGANPNQTFNRQERFKDINGINDDGSRKAKCGKRIKAENGTEIPGMKLAKKLNLLKSTEENPVYAEIDKDLFKDGRISITPVSTNVDAINRSGRDYLNTLLFTIENNGSDSGIIATAPNGKVVNIRYLKDNNKLPAGYSRGNKEYESNLRAARKKLDYIGGDHTASNLNFYKKVPSLINMVDSLSSVYGINKDIMLERLSHEGFNNDLISNYNYIYNKEQQNNIDKDILKYVPNAFTQLGLDRAGEHLAEGHYNMRWIDENLGYTDKTAFNEKGSAVGSVHVPNLASGLEIKAAHIEYLTNLMKKKYPNASKKEIDALINAAYNLGENSEDLNEREWINKNYEVLPWSEMINKSMNNSNKKQLGGRTKAEYGIWERIENSKANFVKRLKDPNRKQIDDWASDGIATHKLSVGTDKNGNHYIFPEVQEINGELIDFTRPPYAPYAGMISAEERGDTVRVNSIDEGLDFTQNYKKKYTSVVNKKQLGGSTGLIRVQANGKDRLMYVPFTGEETKTDRKKTLLGTELSQDERNKLDEWYGKQGVPYYDRVFDKDRYHIAFGTDKQQISTTNTSDVKNGNDKSSGNTNNGNNKSNWWKNNGDYVISGLGNIGAGLTSYFINKNMLKDLNYTPSPVVKRAAKLKTNININPELTALNENLYKTIDSTNANIASSRVANAMNQTAMLNTTLAKNKLYADKENKETALINQDRLNQQEVANANIDAYNTWRTGKTNFENTIREKQSENSISLVDNINSGIQGGLTDYEKRRQFKNNLAVMAAAYPNVTPKLLRSYGFDIELPTLNKFGGKVKLNKKK